jgi:hypothetical protein
VRNQNLSSSLAYQLQTEQVGGCGGSESDARSANMALAALEFASSNSRVSATHTATRPHPTQIILSAKSQTESGERSGLPAAGWLTGRRTPGRTEASGGRSVCTRLPRPDSRRRRRPGPSSGVSGWFIIGMLVQLVLRSKSWLGIPHQRIIGPSSRFLCKLCLGLV